jgi:hypothetical protein
VLAVTSVLVQRTNPLLFCLFCSWRSLPEFCDCVGFRKRHRWAIGELLLRDKHEHKQQEQPDDDDCTNLSRKEEQSIIVHRTVDLWERQGILSKDLADKLLATTTTTTTTTTKAENNHNNNNHFHRDSVLAATLPVIHHYKYFSRNLILRRILFGPWMWLVGEDQAPSGKILAMLALAALAHCRRTTTTIAWEMTRVFFVMVYIGAVTFRVVDTGRHEGETTTTTRQQRDESGKKEEDRILGMRRWACLAAS